MAASSPSFAATTPDAKEAEAAIRLARGKASPSKRFTVTSVDGCFPSSRHNTLICLVRANDDGSSATEPVGFEHSNAGWKAVDPTDISPICPKNEDATSLLQNIKGNKSIIVTGEVDDGKGDFSDQRGLTRERKGPMRLMCRFKVQDSLGNDRLYIAYLSFDNGRYVIDPDIEIWD